jgi:uncharacterized membrane protein YeaQ/YmgE (transglycosylase-associated protein family)
VARIRFVGQLQRALISSVAQGLLHANSANRGAESLGLAQKQETLMPSLDQVIVWIIIGLLGGSLAGLMITRERKGFGILRNLGVGLVGALVGGLVFRVFGIFPGLDRVAISLRDVVAALIGSLLVLAVIWLWQRFRKSE